MLFRSGFGPPTLGEGFIWTEETGMMHLDAYFASFGIVAPDGFHFSLPLGVSDDGLTFWGLGRSDSVFSTGWVVTIPAPGAAPALAAAGLLAARRRRA